MDFLNAYKYGQKNTNKMNAYLQNEDGSGSLTMEYPKSDNNGSLSDASTIPKDGDHLKKGPEEAAALNQNENRKLDRAAARSDGGLN